MNKPSEDKRTSEVIPTISVVIPHYNSSQTLVRALESVAQQSLPVTEVIVVDDMSIASERAAALAAVEMFASVRLITLDINQGPANARNVGWDAASSDWVAFLDSDDAWHPRKLEVQMGAASLSTPRPDLIACVTVTVGSWEELSSIEPPTAVSSHWVRKRDLLVRNQMSTPSVIARRALSERFAEGRKFSEDYQLWLTVTGKGYSALMVDQSLTGIFKPAYGATGLSSHTFRMIAGEYLAYIGARRAGALSRTEMAAGIGFSTVRSSVRLAKIAFRKIARGR